MEPPAVLALNSDLAPGLSRTKPAPSAGSGQALSLSKGVSAPHNRAPHNSVREWLAAAQADVLFEATSLNVENGQPAVDHIRAALEHGAHAITANKGPIVHAYRELRDLASARGKRFLFESTVMDGVPIFSLFHELPVIHLHGFHGILNSTTNVILSEMENGLSFEATLKKAQDLGIAETDATHDIDGWDAAVKTAALITVLMDVPLRLSEIERQGVRGLSGDAVRAARKEGRPYERPDGRHCGHFFVCIFRDGYLSGAGGHRGESRVVRDGVWDAGGFCAVGARVTVFADRHATSYYVARTR